ncbi:hypothetical protein P0D73_39250 [Paraburkholderia sp. RL18-101-BIB-B]|uniref:hypothetical protein n=1 Tax=Paraburkholderia sp. RL18-101-BIB-B TaxID=3031634 RepID=UPI0038BC1CF2
MPHWMREGMIHVTDDVTMLNSHTIMKPIWSASGEMYCASRMEDGETRAMQGDTG